MKSMYINFKYNQEKDISNYNVVVKSFSTSQSSKAVEDYKKIFGENIDDEKLALFINKIIQKQNLDIANIVKNIEGKWSLIENEFLLKCEKIFNTKLDFNFVTAYITTCDKCSYSYKNGYFFVRANAHYPVKIIMHELLHFFTLQRFEKELRPLDNKVRYHIVESLTEMLNIEFISLLDAPDQGYRGHEEVRELVRLEWLKNKNIESVILKLLDFV